MPESNTNGKDLPNGSVVADHPKSTKRSHKSGKMVPQKPYLIAIIVLAVLAVAGAGFGVAELVINSHSDQNKAQLEQTGDQDGKTDGADEDDHVADDDKDIADETEGFTAKNLLIRHDKVMNPSNQNLPPFNYSLFAENYGVDVMVDSIEKGTAASCNGEIVKDSSYKVTVSLNWPEIEKLYGIKPKSNRNDNYETKEITDIDGARVVSVMVAPFGQMASGSTILFLMDDGTIEYIPVERAISEGFHSYGKIRDVKGVVSLQSVSINTGCEGGGLTTLALKADGEFYDLQSILSEMKAWN